MGAKHTPGPFHAETRFIDGDNGVLSSDGYRVADVPTYQSRKARNGRLVRREISVEEQMANVALFAAAPDLAVVLEAFVEEQHAKHCSDAGHDRLCWRARAALRAAGRIP